MINASVRDKLEREIRRTENHLEALKDLLDEVLDVAPRKGANEGLTSRIPLVEEALAMVRGDRVFSVKEVTAFAQRIDPEIDRRLIYNCIKSYLQTSAKRGEVEQISSTEYQRVIKEEDDERNRTARRGADDRTRTSSNEQSETLRRLQRSRGAAEAPERSPGRTTRRSRA